MSREGNKKLKDNSLKKLRPKSEGDKQDSSKLAANAPPSLDANELNATIPLNENLTILTDNYSIGKYIGNYEIVRKIGIGGMGEVYLAKDKKLERLVAVKILNGKYSCHESNLNRFIREARAASSLNHPNILIIHEINEADGTQYIVSEFIEGTTLREIVELSNLKLREILDISIQIANALSAAHAAGIVHRDIKPENIIVRPDGYVKILDFGLAKLIGQQNIPFNGLEDKNTQYETTNGLIMGTVNYMSPEQAKGEKIDEKTDIFSLGAVIYEMVAGKAPFAGDSLAETFADLINREPPPLEQVAPSIPGELRQIISKALKKNKQDRYQAMKDLLFELKELRENLEDNDKLRYSIDSNNVATQILPAVTDNVSEVHITARPLFGRERIRTKWLWLATVGLIALVLSALGVFNFYFRPTELSRIKSVLVLPLKNMSGDRQDEYLSDGITDELITKLTKLKIVRVVSPSVSMRYKDSVEDAAAIGRESNVEAVVEGTVRKQGSRFRVSIHLVNAKDGFEIWSENGFESDLSDLLDVQSQIAEAVANKLKGQLTLQERGLLDNSTTTNADAYELYLRGKQQFRQHEGQVARGLFDRAVQLDPNFADAYAWRGRTIYEEFKTGNGDRVNLNAALADANRALQIDPDIIAARRTLISIYHSTGQYEEGLKQGKAALESNADDFDAIEGAALAYFRAGILNKAIPLYQRALASDPANHEVRNALARTYIAAGEYQKGLDVLSPLLEQKRDGWWVAMSGYRGLGQFDKAIEAGENGLDQESIDNPNIMLDLGDVLKAAGKPEEARRVWVKGARRLEAKLASFENVRTRIWLGYAYAHLGEKEKALEEIRLALDLEPNDAWTLFQAGTVRAILNDRIEAVGYIQKAIAHGWLGIHYMDVRPNDNDDLATLRNVPEFQQIQSDLRKKVDELAEKY